MRKPQWVGPEWYLDEALKDTRTITSSVDRIDARLQEVNGEQCAAYGQVYIILAGMGETARLLESLLRLLKWECQSQSPNEEEEG